MAAAFDLPGLADFGMAAVLEFTEEPRAGRSNAREGLPVVSCQVSICRHLQDFAGIQVHVMLLYQNGCTLCFKISSTSQHNTWENDRKTMKNLALSRDRHTPSSISACHHQVLPIAQVMMHGMGDFGNLAHNMIFQ